MTVLIVVYIDALSTGLDVCLSLMLPLMRAGIW